MAGARLLRDRCDEMSSSVLYQRLGELTEAALIERNDDGDYTLAPAGQRLGAAIAPLEEWAQAWAAEAVEPDRK